MQVPKCQLCDAEIDPVSLRTEFSELISVLDACGKDDLTDIEESIYLMKICRECAIKESS